MPVDEIACRSNGGDSYTNWRINYRDSCTDGHHTQVNDFTNFVKSFKDNAFLASLSLCGHVYIISQMHENVNNKHYDCGWSGSGSKNSTGTNLKP